MSVTLVIFGGAGDLAHRKLLPALYNLHVDGLLPSPFAVVGVGRRDYDDEGYRAFARDGVEHFSRRPIDPAMWDGLARQLYFVNANIEEPSAFTQLGSRLDSIEHEKGLSGDRIYYLAVPPAIFVPTVTQLQHARFVPPPGAKTSARLIVEKPIGHDLASAMAINDAIAEVFAEQQIFRIDHYLGKETVQNILVLRFANSVFEPLFNHRFVDHVQITVAEEEGVGTRASYYEQAGALRDMVQNHLMQLLALTGMEPPYSLDADVVRDERLEVIQALRPIVGEDVDRQIVRAQYAGNEAAGQVAYTAEPGVDRQSKVETYVALQVFVDNWRWAGVPFFLRTGKRLTKRCSEIAIFLKDVPPILFNRPSERKLASDIILLRIQPNESFALSISSKVPGTRLKIVPVEMDLDYCRAFGKSSPEAYERLLLDVMNGDATLFMRRDMVETSWKWITPILDRWSRLPNATLPTYTAGTAGPVEADRLIEATGRKWRTL
ncbi:MAG TPA: glucose-6-phosphate dehydrogenase [Vicinamibacterales bacterium]|nr:glucose-6-phosphate dehydrogenase [Vicinamibacterales bacterium]